MLVGIICDHPAMCKVIGCADHGHKNAPCHKCTVSKDDMFSEASLRNGIVIGLQIHMSNSE